MKSKNNGLKKATKIIIGTIFILVVLIFVFLSPITKYLIEKNDVKYFGREVKLNWVYINPFTGYVYINNLKIYEVKSDTIFFSANDVSANFEMLKLFSKTYEISQLNINKPIGIISQNKKQLNFDDLIEKFSSKNKTSYKHKEPVHFNILNLKIIDGLFYYNEKTIPVHYSIKHVNIVSTGKMWNTDTIAAKFSFASGNSKGNVSGNTVINIESLEYKFATKVNKYDLSFLDQYLKDISNYGSISANIDGDFKAKGNFKNIEDIDANGIIAINDFHFGKSKTEDYAAFKKFTLNIVELSPKNKKYLLDSVSLLEPYFKYELYDHLDNFQAMFGKDGGKVIEAKYSSGNTNILFQIADYVKLLVKNFFKSNFEVKRLAIYKANTHFIDYSINEKFDVSATPFYIFADSIRRSDKWVNLSFRTGVKPYGKVSVDINMNPKDSSDFNINYHLRQIPAAMFNPYLITYTSFPLDRGTLELKGAWQVRNGIIKSNNHFILVDPRLHNKQKHKGAKWIPLKLIMFFARERGNVIDYEIPITGNLKNPKFKLKDIILDALTNLFVKPLTTLYRTEIKNVENEIEASFALKWEIRKNELESNQKKFTQKLSNYLINHPEMKISITPILYDEKEKEHLLFFEAKKMYYLSKHKIKLESLSNDDSVSIDRIYIKDSLFVHYLNTLNGNKMLHTVQDKCANLVGLNRINSLYNKLAIERKNTFMLYFKKEGIESKVIFKPTQHKIPYNGFSFYKIDYKSQWPEELKKAYERIIDLNNKSPRDKFKRERSKTE